MLSHQENVLDTRKKMQGKKKGRKENAGKRKCRQWKIQRTEKAGNGKFAQWKMIMK